MGLIEEISEFLQKGRSKKVKELVQKAMDENMDPKVILNEGLLSGMMIVGAKFKNNEVFVPEVLVSARAMNAGLAILEPKLVEASGQRAGGKGRDRNRAGRSARYRQEPGRHDVQGSRI